MIEVPAGVHLSAHDVRALLAVLEAACEHAAPGARAADVIRRLMVSDEKLTRTSENTDAGVQCDADAAHTAAYDLVDAREAAAILGISAHAVRDLARRGRLPAHRANGGWLYPARAVVDRAERKAARRTG